jgi:hypothetical protein
MSFFAMPFYDALTIVLKNGMNPICILSLLRKPRPPGVVRAAGSAGHGSFFHTE